MMLLVSLSFLRGAFLFFLSLFLFLCFLSFMVASLLWLFNSFVLQVIIVFGLLPFV